MNPPVVFDRVWKKFRLGEHHDSLRDLVPSMAARVLGRRRRQASVDQEFWAVSDVSFEVRPGEALGIIGPNGAGKSTVLKLLTRILKPTRGACAVRGRVGALIEVAAGFHPDLTGRENIFLQGAIVGMKRAEIARKFDQIVEFAGINEFVDTPVKRFSSGMNARLGFAIAAHLDPDVLIIDEVLSVGDADFQERCLTRMRELVTRGVPLVSVSHNLPSILELCTHAILLNRGHVVFSGNAVQTVQAYRCASHTHQAAGAVPAGDVRITHVSTLDAAGTPSERFSGASRLMIRVGYETSRPVAHPEFAVDIHRVDGVYSFGVSTRIDQQDIGVINGRGHIDLDIQSLALVPGRYTLSVGIHKPGIGICDLHQFAYPLTVTSDRRDLGLVTLVHSWRHEPDHDYRPTPGATRYAVHDNAGAVPYALTTGGSTVS